MASNIGYHFAMALMRSGKKSGDLERIQGDLERVSELIASERLAVYMLLHPLVPYERKRRFLEAVCETEAARRLIKVLIETNSLGLLPNIAKQLFAVAARELGRVRARVTAAADLGAADKERLREALAEVLGKPVDLEVRVEPRVLGRIALRVGDTVIDNTVRTKLKTAKARLGR